MEEDEIRVLHSDAEAEQRLTELIAVEKAREEVIQKGKTQRLAMIVVPVMLVALFLGPFILDLLKDIFSK